VPPLFGGGGEFGDGVDLGVVDVEGAGIVVGVSGGAFLGVEAVGGVEELEVVVVV